jgi:hypothetical protein
MWESDEMILSFPNTCSAVRLTAAAVLIAYPPVVRTLISFIIIPFCDSCPGALWAIPAIGHW